MGENSIINFGDLSKPATVLIEKISDAIGGVFKPYQIRRTAEAEAKAEKIKAIAKIEITKLQQRALRRFMIEEARKQNNIEKIIRKSLPDLKEEARPRDIEQDWIINFFDKSRLISDEQMQDLWARILAGEANAPGSFSKRTIYQLSSLDKKDALIFNNLCCFICDISVNTILIFDYKTEIYQKKGINFDSLNHLDSIGLISFQPLTGYIRTGFSKNIKVTYKETSLTIEFPKDKDNELKIGSVLLTNVGKELSTICKSEKIDGFVEYIIKEWGKSGLKLEIDK